MCMLITVKFAAMSAARSVVFSHEDLKKNSTFTRDTNIELSGEVSGGQPVILLALKTPLGSA